MHHGKLRDANFNTDLAAAVNTLGPHHAVIFTADSGDLSGTTWVVVDVDGVVGYSANNDYVIQLGTPVHLSSADVTDFQA